MAGRAGRRASGCESSRVHLRAVAAGVELRRAALGPTSLRVVRDRRRRLPRAGRGARASLAQVADDLREAARDAEALADRIEARGPSP